jgi:hypothetical protein
VLHACSFCLVTRCIAKAFLSLAAVPDTKVIRGGTFLFNTTLDDTDADAFKHVDAVMVPPILVPSAVAHLGAVWEILSTETKPLLESAIKAGVFLDRSQLKDVCILRQVPSPLKGSGKADRKTGAQRKLKKDWAASLVKFLFPEDDRMEQDRMINAIIGARTDVILGDECPAEIAAAVAGLDRRDVENSMAFRDLHVLSEEVLKKKHAARRICDATSFYFVMYFKAICSKCAFPFGYNCCLNHLRVRCYLMCVVVTSSLHTLPRSHTQ